MTTTETVTRYALRQNTVMDLGAPLYVLHLEAYTMPQNTEDQAIAKTWAWPQGAKDAARRHHLTNVTVVPVQRPLKVQP